ncbi:MAG: HD domain-containing protein [Planctomycetaceae bacterium]
MSTDKLRRQILAETSRLLREGQEPQLGTARIKAARNMAGGWVHRDRLPSHQEVRGDLFRQAELLSRSESFSVDESDGEAERFARYRVLLEPLSLVLQSRERHPEGDALYHSLQVFALMQSAAPWDEELQLAALLHDVGKGLDPQNHVESGLAALAGMITDRTAWLIANHSDAQRLHEGTLGARALRRLSGHPDFDSLLLLARCDREGRVPGRSVPSAEEALDAIQKLAEMCNGDDWEQLQ